nr:MAG TPA: hypothetical protein [Caudoviricetes sp.]
MLPSPDFELFQGLRTVGNIRCYRGIYSHIFARF